jgi:hypothetical protein
MQTPVPAAWLAPPRLACCPSAACTRHHLHGPLLALALQPGVHAPLCTGLLLEPPCSQTHVPYFLTPAAHARGTAVLAGADRRYSTAAETAETMHKQMRAFAAAQGPCTLQSFGESCEHAVKMFNEAAEAHWHRMFVLRVQIQPRTRPDSQRVLLQMGCLSDDDDDDCKARVLTPAESIAAELAVVVTHNDRHRLSVECEQFVVVRCLQGMSMDKLLYACGLLCAQQFACHANKHKSVEITGDFFRQVLQPQSHQTLQSVETAATLLWEWYSETLRIRYTEPLPRQVSRKRVGPQRGQKRYEQLLATAQSMHETMPKTEELFGLKHFGRALSSAADIMNRHAGEDWGKFFRFTVAPTEPTMRNSVAFFLQIACNWADGSEESAGLHAGDANTVAARLLLEVHAGRQERDFKCWGVLCSFYVEMEVGVTVICLRQMYLATLLRACALLATQQFAYFAGGEHSVGFQGMAASTGSQLIYDEMFKEIRVYTDEIARFTSHHAIVRARAEEVPQSIMVVARMLTDSLRKSAQMYKAPLPAQIRDRVHAQP